MSDIIFVNPPLTLRERYGKLSFAANTLPSLGICWLAAMTRQGGFGTRIIEANSLGLSQAEVISQILEAMPEYLAISATTCSIFSAGKLAQLVKVKKPGIKIIIGGPHLTALPEETMMLCPDFDIGVIGEGEDTLIELLGNNGKSDNLRLIKGLIFRQNGELVVTEKRLLMHDLDRLPFPAWDLLPDFPRRYRPIMSRFRRLPAASLVTTRGCPNRCVFCDRAVFGNVCRSFSPEYTFEMIKILYFEYGVREILFEDDTFFLFKNNLRAVCEVILKNNLDLSWSCLGRIDMVDIDLLKLMRRAGCWQIGYGIESGSQLILDLMQKGITLNQVKKAVRLTKQAGIKAKGFFILGFPGENHLTIRQTEDFIRELELDDITVAQFTPLPGSKIYNNIDQYGDFDKNWGRMNLLENVFVPEGLTQKDLMNYSKQINSRFYLRPKIIFSYLKRLLSFIRPYTPKE